MSDVLACVERSVLAALETYSNVHRGSGHHSMVTTRLFEQARAIILDHLALSAKSYCVVFCTPRRATLLEAGLPPGSCRCLSSQDVGLPLGLRALVIRRKALPKGIPFQTGGGTARLIGGDWAIWTGAPDRFEAGTPAIVSVIAFARALQCLGRRVGGDQVRVPAASSSNGAAVERDGLAGLVGLELLDGLRATLVGRGGRVPTSTGERRFVNLDNAASTPTFAPIWEEVRRAWRATKADQSKIVQHGRQVCAEALGTSLASHDVLFTSNTTEAINLVAESFAKRPRSDVQPVVLNTLLEHNSNELPWRAWRGAHLVRLPMDAEGSIDLAMLERKLHEYNQDHAHGRRRIELVAVTGASNVLGVYNDVAAIGRLAHRHGARLLVDGAQWVAHRKVDIEGCGIDFLAFSGHKTYAPFGTGVLIARKGLLAFAPDELAQIRASGAENVGGIAALAKALSLLDRIGLDAIQAEEQALTRRVLTGLGRLPRVTAFGVTSVNSASFGRKGGVIAFVVKGRLPGTVARTLAERGGIGTRYGCHCAHLTVKRMLRVPPWAERLQYLIARAIPRFSPPGVVRVSMGLQTTVTDVDDFLAEVGDERRHRSSKVLKRHLDDFLRASSERVFGQ